jgi:hypothetical protein
VFTYLLCNYFGVPLCTALDVLNKYLKALTINYIHTYIHT